MKRYSVVEKAEAGSGRASKAMPRNWKLMPRRSHRKGDMAGLATRSSSVWARRI